MFKTDKFGPIEAALLKYFNEHVKDSPRYFKAKHLAKDIGLSLSSNKIGTCLSIMCEKKPSKLKGLKITNHSYSNATTWRVERVSRTG